MKERRGKVLSEGIFGDGEGDFRRVIEMAPDGHMIVDQRGILRYVNQAGARFFGREANGLIGVPFGFPLVSGETTQIALLQSKGKPLSVEMRVIEVEWEGEVACLASLRDITERVRMEEELKTSRTRLEEAQRIARVGNWEWNIAGDNLYCSQELHRIVGNGSSDMKGNYKALLDLVFPEDRRSVEEAIAEALRSSGVFDIQHRVVFSDGTVRTVQETGKVDFDRDGKPLRIVATTQDITEATLLEKKLKQQMHWMGILNKVSRSILERQTIESILRVVLNYIEEYFSFDVGAASASLQQDKRFQIVTIGRSNGALAKRLGIQIGESTIPNLFEITKEIKRNAVNVIDLTGADQSLLPDEKKRVLKRVLKEGLHHLILIPIVSDSGQACMISLLFREDPSGMDNELWFLESMTQVLVLAVRQAGLYSELQEAFRKLKENQKQTMENARLRAMGQMASGINHDINNNLSPITLYTEALLETEPHLSERAKHFIKTIQTAVNDIENTTTRLRSFYRHTEEEESFRPLSAVELVTAAVYLSRPRWQTIPQRKGTVIDIKTSVAKSLPPFRGLESEIHEALLNLIFNAVDAMPGGGTIKIRGGRKKSMVFIEVADSGCGMSEETRNRCLDPFFSTKGGRGTGLGLSAAYGVMERHRGEIQVESEPGRGTTVRLLFPVNIFHNSEISLGEEVVVPIILLKILYIDDDQMAREALVEILRLSGYEVVGATGGEEGVAAFSEALDTGKPFDVVITDLGMPHVDGKEVARRIKKQSPQTPIILLSGWGRQMAEEEEGEEKPEGIDRILSKPPQMQLLRRTLYEVVTDGAKGVGI